jgi:hypothetical protein
MFKFLKKDRPPNPDPTQGYTVVVSEKGVKHWTSKDRARLVAKNVRRDAKVSFSSTKYLDLYQ